MRRTLPSLTALESFDAVARLGHVTRAADELGRTQSAVSRQIANLEDFARRPLFSRNHRRLELTTAGRWFAEQIGDLLDQLEAHSTRLITFDAHDRQIRLGVLPTFSSRWLIPRLGSFRAAERGLEVHLLTGTGEFDLRRDDIDAVIQLGLPEGPEVASYRLFPEFAVAVCAPELFQPGIKITDLERLEAIRQPWLWEAWLEASHQPGPRSISVLRIENVTVAIDAACRGGRRDSRRTGRGR